MRKDVVVDIETLSTETNTTLLQLSALVFDIKTGNTLDEFNFHVDISKCKNLVVSGDTLKWWLKTDKELFTELINKGTHSEQDILYEFNLFLNNHNEGSNIYFWGNGILFDNKIIQSKMKQYDLDYPIFYRNDRDMRTLVELYCEKFKVNSKEFIKSFNNGEHTLHNALDDCKLQAKIISFCFNSLINN
jgi:hypothetical protein